MKASVASFAALLSSASAFIAPTPLVTKNAMVTTRGSAVSMKAQTQTAQSEALPFLPQPDRLDGSVPGDFGFDPIGFTNLDFDFNEIIVPGSGALREDKVGEKSPVDTVYWMQEAEIKNGRTAMLAVIGWQLVDQGVRFPGSQYDSIGYSIDAHDPMVSAGNMILLLLFCGLIEMVGASQIFGAALGSGRVAGDFGWDPLELTSDPAEKERLQVSEVKHCRLAMLAFAYIVFEAIRNGGTFP